MSKQASPVAIGAFVLGAIAITLVAVVALGSGRLFRSTENFLLFFQGSVNGLDKGAPVKYRGVPIGVVTDILLAVPQLKGDPRIPVVIEIDNDRLNELGSSLNLATDPESLKALIEQAGLRAQLQQQSFITGQLFIGLDLFPDSKLEMVLPPGSGPHPELPTLPTKLEQLQAKIEAVLDKLGKIDWESVGTSAAATVEGLNKLVNSPEIQSTLVALRQTLTELRDAIGPVQKGATSATKELTAALKRLQLSLDRLDTLTDPKAPLVNSVNGALSEVAEAARAVRRLAEDLDRDPSVILRGKSK